MEIFKQLKKLGYKHYVDLTIEELDKLPIDNIERRIECSLVIDWFREKHLIEILILPQNQSACDPTPLYFIAIESYKNETFLELFNSTNDNDLLHYHLYYEAREQAILKAIELIKGKNQ